LAGLDTGLPEAISYPVWCAFALSADIVANAAHEALLRKQAAAVGHDNPHLLLEPVRRDSAAAIAAGVAFAARRFGAESLIAVMPCDHLIPDVSAFSKTLEEGFDLARIGFLGTFGIIPTWPSPEFGYIQSGEPIAGHATARRVAMFHEKPSPERAGGYLAAGGYAWNSGMFVFKAGAFTAEAQQHMPEIQEPISESVSKARHEKSSSFLDPDSFARSRKTSIDYALFEKSDRVGVVPAGFAWSDVGTWNAVHEALTSSGDDAAAANARIGDVTLKDASGCLAIAEPGTRLVLIGLEDVVAITTPQGTFVAPRARAAEIKAIIES
jgi:mannose-1-phosphate guanylyltransferase / mannose-6-phosphate isomerase